MSWTRPCSSSIHAGVVDPGGVLEDRVDDRAHRHQQRVVVEFRAGRQLRAPRVDVDPDQRVGDQLRPGLLDELGQRHARRVAAVERLADRQRPVHEVRPDRDDPDPDPVRGEVLQRERRLQAGDATTGDQNLKAPAALCGGVMCLLANHLFLDLVVGAWGGAVRAWGLSSPPSTSSGHGEVASSRAAVPIEPIGRPAWAWTRPGPRRRPPPPPRSPVPRSRRRHGSRAATRQPLVGAAPGFGP